MSFIGGLSTPIPAGASGFAIDPDIPGLATPESSPPRLAATPSRDSTSDKVGATLAQFRVDEGGNATYSVPIQVPPGTAGMAPKLALTYNSRGPNGVMGPGWSIEGASQIARCRQTRENGDFMSGTTPLDGNPAPVNFTQSDRFCLDGVRLLLTSGSYGANNSVYSPENDPTTQVTATVTTTAAGPDTFLVKRKDGSTSTYGKRDTSSNALITATLPATGATVAVSWNLARVQDTAGNYIDYVYNLRPGSGTYPVPAVEFTLAQVNYTGHATTPVSSTYASVSFSYATLPTTSQVRLGYQAGIAFLQSQQLSSVAVSDSTLGSPTVRYYALTYQTSGSGSGWPQVSKITECRDSTQSVCFVPTTFTWSAANHAFGDSANQTGPSFANLAGYKLADVDGDGRVDLVYAVNNDIHCSGASAIYVGYLDKTSSSQMTLTTNGQVPLCAPINLLNHDLAWYLLDYDGDGKADLLIGGNTGTNWALHTGIGRSGSSAFNTSDALAGIAITVPSDVPVAAGLLADLNGDGLPDFVYPIANVNVAGAVPLQARLLQRRSNGTLAFSDAYSISFSDLSNCHQPGATVECDFNFFGTGARSAITADINGDGRSDLTLLVEATIDTGDPQESADDRVIFDPSLGAEEPQNSPNGVITQSFWKQLAVLNITPPAGSTAGNVQFKQYWSEPVSNSGGVLPPTSNKFYVADLNGDGLADILYQDFSSPTTYHAKINLGSGYLPAIAVTGISSTTPIQLADVNGDGKTDLVYLSSTSASYVSLVPTTSASTPWAFSGPATVPGGGVKASSSQAALLGDFDGDGAADFLAFSASGGSNNLYASRSAGTPSGSCKAATNAAACSRYHARDVIVGFTNGLGAATTVAYQPLTNLGVYQQTVANSRAVTNDVYGYGSPVFDVLAPIYVVSEAHSSAPTQGNPAATSNVYYRYEGALMQAGGRGFLGFWETWAFDDNDSAAEGNKYMVTLNGYGQDYPFIGVPETTFKLAFAGGLSRGSATLDSCALNGPEATAGCFNASRWPDLLHSTGVTVGYSGTQPACLGAGCTALPGSAAAQCTSAATQSDLDDAGNPITNGLFTPPAIPGPIFVYAWRSSDTQYELTSPASSPMKTTGTQTTSCYDGSSLPSYGNLLNNRIVTSDGNGIVAQKLMANTYSDTTANWRLGRLTQSQITFMRPGQSDVVRKSSFTYDPATGFLDSERIQSGGGADQDLRTRYTLDAWGNRTGAYQCTSDLGDSACTSTSFAQQLAYGTSVHRYAKTTWDTRGRYTTGSKLPFYTSSGSTHLSELTAISVTARDEFGNPTTQSSINGLTQTSLFGAMGRPYFASDNTGKASTTTYRTCLHSGTDPNQVGCSNDTMLKFRAQTVTAGAPTVWTYYDVLGRAVLSIKQAYDGNDAGKQFTAACSYRDAHDRPKYQSEPFFLNVGANADGSPNLTATSSSPCASAAYATTTQYDVLGRVVLVTNPDGGQIKRQYTGLETDTRNPRNYVWSETKNALGEVVRTQDPVVTGDASVGVFVDTAYDAAGNVLTVSRDAQHNGAATSTTKIVTTFTYDALGRKKTQVDPDSGTTTFSYNAAGDVIYQKDAKNQTIQQSFDAMGRRWKRVANGADGNTLTDTWTYDISANGYGQLASETRAATTGTPFTRTFGYDGYGRSNGRTTSVNSVGYSEVTAYDEYGRPKSQQDASGYSLSTTYSAKGYVSQLTDSRAGTVYVVDTMTARDQVEKDRRAGSTALASTMTYAAATGRISTVCTGAQKSGTGHCNLQDLAYTFDNGGDLLSRTRASSSAPTSELFTHDALDRMTLAKLTSVQGIAQSPAVTTTSLTYDLLGNLCAKNGVAYTYAGRAGCTGSGTSGSPHAVANTTQGGLSTHYGYDGNGNQTSSSDPSTSIARTISYNALNQPTKVVLTHTVTGNTAHVEFEYGPDGDRFREYMGGCDSLSSPGCIGVMENSTLIYVGNVEIRNSTRYRRYLGGVAIDTVESGAGTTNYVYADHLGSLDVIVSSTGAVVSRMSYDVHGSYRDPVTWQGQGTGSNVTPRGFTGQEQLDFFGFIHMNGRLYDPKLGRMLEADPLTGPGSQGLNGYSYVVNNPLVLTDPSGYSWWHNLDRIAGWITFGPGFPTIRSDYYAFLGNPYVRLVGAIIAGYFTFGAVYGAFSTEFLAGTGGTIVAGASAGAASGFVSSAIQTRSFQMAWRGAAAGAVAGGIAGYYGNTQSLQRVGVETVAGGVESRIQGGDFIDGVKFAFIVSSLSYANYRMRKHEWERASQRYYNVDGDGNGMYGIGGKLAGSRRETDPDVEYMLGLKCDATAGGCQGAPVNPGDVRARLGPVDYESASALNSIAESFAGPHDWLRDMTGSYDQWGNSNHFEGLSATLDSVRNYVEIPMAAPFAVGGLIHETPGVYLPLQCMTVGECN